MSTTTEMGATVQKHWDTCSEFKSLCRSVEGSNTRGITFVAREEHIIQIYNIQN